METSKPSLMAAFALATAIGAFLAIWAAVFSAAAIN